MAHYYFTSCHVASQYTALLCTTPHLYLYNTPTTTLFFVHTALLVTETQTQTRAIMLYDSPCLPACLPSSHPPFVHPSLSPFVPFLSFTFHTYTYITPAERHFITLCSRTTKSLLTPHITQSHYPPPFQSFLSFFSHFHPSLSCKYKYNQIIYDIAENQPLFNCNEICSFPALD